MDQANQPGYEPSVTDRARHAAISARAAGTSTANHFVARLRAGKQFPGDLALLLEALNGPVQEAFIRQLEVLWKEPLCS